MDKKVDQFKKELRTYRGLKEELIEKKEQLKIAWYDMTGVKGVDAAKIRVQYNQHIADMNRHTQSEKLEKIVKEIERLEANIWHIDEILLAMPPDARAYATDIYIKGRTFDATSGKYYLSRSAILARIDRSILKALNRTHPTL